MAKIIALVGPTASGKSDLAIEIAKANHAHILSCDSLIIYRGMNIGTAKPSTEEMAGVPHHGVDIAELGQDFTAGDYVRYARPILDKLVNDGTPIVIAGGTGFYLKALLCGVWDAPPTQPQIRERLENEVAKLPHGDRPRALHDKLAALDAEYAKKIMVNDTYRVVRAIEIIETTGKTMGELLATRALQNPLPYPFKILGIKRDRKELERRIIRRTDAMFAQGLVNETKQIVTQYPTPPRPLSCVGYHEVQEFLAGKLSIMECREQVVISTRQLAKKQMTFFKTFPAPIEWFSLPSETEALVTKANEILANK